MHLFTLLNVFQNLHYSVLFPIYTWMYIRKTSLTLTNINLFRELLEVHVDSRNALSKIIIWSLYIRDPLISTPQKTPPNLQINILFAKLLLTH